MKKILRVFISSTFNDFRLERAVLQKYVFPKIKKEAHKKGISFLPIDLRWGVPEEAQIDQRTMDICLNEVKRSLTQPHPDFIILSGNKYGWIPLPRIIEKNEFEKILSHLQNLNKDISILKKWYELDYNQIPASYVLKSRDEVKDKDFTIWQNWIEAENQIRGLLQLAVNKLNIKNKEKYFTSATHEEFKTFLKYKKNKLNKHIISFIREFNDIENIKDQKIKNLLTDDDLTKIKNFQEAIKNHTLKENLLEKSVTSKVYEEEFRNRDYIESIFENIQTLEELQTLTNKKFAQYLIDFANFIEERLLNSFKNIKTDFSEKDYQKDFKNYLLNKPFVGREKKIKEIINAVNKNNRVLIYGESGVGKSSLLARVIDELEKEKDADIVYRFSSATQKSSTLISLLNSIIEELGFEIKEEKNNINNTDNIKNTLIEIGNKLNSINKKTIIIIDAIDQLQSAPNDNLEWLPYNENIKIVISALNDKEYDDDSLYFKKFQFFPAKIEIKKLKNPKEVLQSLLKQEKRTLTEEQYNYVLSKKESNKPLYLNIAKEGLKFWKSSDTLTNSKNKENKTIRYLSETQKEIIEEYINNLYKIHHIIPQFVKKVFGYLSASQEHLSEEFLLAVLSKDEELLKNIENIYHKNLTHELPPAVWSRFRWMIKNYIKEDEKGYIKFYHREFEAILENFYSNEYAKKLTLILEELFPNEYALIAHGHTLANRVNHNDKIEEKNYERIIKKLKTVSDENLGLYFNNIHMTGVYLSKKNF